MLSLLQDIFYRYFTTSLGWFPLVPATSLPGASLVLGPGISRTWQPRHQHLRYSAAFSSFEAAIIFKMMFIALVDMVPMICYAFYRFIFMMVFRIFGALDIMFLLEAEHSFSLFLASSLIYLSFILILPLAYINFTFL